MKAGRNADFVNLVPNEFLSFFEKYDFRSLAALR